MATASAKGLPRGLPKGRPKVPGSGRKKGTPNKWTKAHREKLVQMKLDSTDPMSFIMSILRNKDAPYAERKWAAAELLPYAHPKLASIEARTGGQTHEDRLKELQDLLSDVPAALEEAPKVPAVIDIPDVLDVLDLVSEETPQ